MNQIVDLSDGNPGAIKTLMFLFRGYEDAGARNYIDHLEELGIRGSKIYNLGVIKSERNIGKFIILLRASIKGILEDGYLKNLSENLDATGVTPGQWFEIEEQLDALYLADALDLAEELDNG